MPDFGAHQQREILMRTRAIKPLFVTISTLLLSGCMSLPKWAGGGEEKRAEGTEPAVNAVESTAVSRPSVDEVRTLRPINRGQTRWQSVPNEVVNLAGVNERIDDRPPLIAAMPSEAKTAGEQAAADTGVSYNTYVKERGVPSIPGQPLEPQAVVTIDGYERQIKQLKAELGQKEIAAPALERPAPRSNELPLPLREKPVSKPSLVLPPEPEPAQTFGKPTSGYFVQVMSSFDRAQIEQELKRQSSWKGAKVVKLRRNTETKDLYYIVILGPYPTLSAARQVLTKPNVPRDAWVRGAASIRKLWP